MPRLVETPGLEQRAAEGDAGRQVGGMPLQSGFTDGDRVLELSAAAIFLGERGERDRRRIQLDPASQFLDARAVGHAGESAPESTTRAMAAVITGVIGSLVGTSLRRPDRDVGGRDRR